MKNKLKRSLLLMLAAALLLSGSAAYAAPVKYVGIHYFTWYGADSPWDGTWGLNSNALYFENGNYAGFTTTGTAFGSAPRSTAHGALNGWEGSYWADSFAGGETAVGTLKSTVFTMKTGTFRFKAAGYDGASGTKNQNYYYLRRASDNAILLSSKPPQSDTFAWVTWNTAAYVNTDVYFQAVDNNSDSSYAWLAVDGTTPVIPSIGRYSSTVAAAEAHAATLKDMGVDFIFADGTNNTIWGPGNAGSPVDWIWNNTKATSDGFSHVPGGPKVAELLSITSWDSPTTSVQRLLTKNYTTGYPWIPTNSGDLFLQKISMVYNELAYDSSRYFYYEGKPLLGLFVAAPATVYDENNVDQTPNGKLPDSWDPVIPNTGGKKLRELFTIRWVGAFQNQSGNPKYVPAAGDTLKAYNGHWSWEDGTPQTWASRSNSWGDTPDSVTIAPFARTPLQGRNGGLTFASMWERANDVDPLIAMLHSWNEFSGSGDEPSPEYSQSIEPTTFYYQDTYKNLAKSYIAQFKSYRMDISLYDTSSGSRKVFLKNRTHDAGGYSFDFNFETSYSMDRGASVEYISGDFNGDGKTDIAIRNITDGTVAIRYSPYFTVEASGGQPAEKVVTLESGSRYKMFAGDFNNDGKADLGYYDTVGGAGGPGFIIRYNDGSSGFGTAYTWPWTLSASYQYGSADINGDGRSDLVYRDPASGTIYFALAKTDGLQTKPSSLYSFPWSAGAGSGFQLFTGNADGNAYQDVGIRNTSTGTFHMQQNQNTQTGSTWNFTNQQTFTWAAGAQYLPVTGDFR